MYRQIECLTHMLESSIDLYVYLSWSLGVFQGNHSQSKINLVFQIVFKTVIWMVRRAGGNIVSMLSLDNILFQIQFSSIEQQERKVKQMSWWRIHSMYSWSIVRSPHRITISFLFNCPFLERNMLTAHYCLRGLLYSKENKTLLFTFVIPHFLGIHSSHIKV